MLVCHCRAVKEREVCAAIAYGARTVRAVALSCGAGSICGGCVPTVRKFLRDAGMNVDVSGGDEVVLPDNCPLLQAAG